MQAARWLGWQAWHFHDSRRIVSRGGRHIAIGDRNAAGFPDLALAHPVHGFAVAELKTETGRLRPKQRVALAALEAAGVQTFLWRPSDWPLIEEFLKTGAAPDAAGQPVPGRARAAAPQTTQEAA